MNAADASSVYHELRELLRDARLTWVLELMDAKASHGVHAEYKLRRYVESTSPDEGASTKPGRHETVQGVRPLNEVELLGLLLDEIENAVVVPLRIANQLPGLLTTPDSPVDAIEIADEADGTVFRVNAGQQVRGEVISELISAIAQIREEM